MHQRFLNISFPADKFDGYDLRNSGINNKIIMYYLIILYLAFDFIITLVACTQDSHFGFILVSGLKRRPQTQFKF